MKGSTLKNKLKIICFKKWFLFYYYY